MSVDLKCMLDVLKDAYTVYFDEVDQPREMPFLAASYAFHSTNEGYVLSKKIKLWSAETHEYVYVFSVPEFTAEICKTCRDNAYAAGMQNIHPHIDHMTSYITAIVLCERMTDAAARLLEKTRIRKNFLFSLYGWMEFRAVALDLSMGKIVVNSAARDLKNFLCENMEKAQLRRS